MLLWPTPMLPLQKAQQALIDALAKADVTEERLEELRRQVANALQAVRRAGRNLDKITEKGIETVKKAEQFIEEANETTQAVE